MSVYIVTNYEGSVVLRTTSEMAVAAFLNGVIHGGSEIVDYNVIKDGSVILKTLLVNKYYIGGLEEK